jgi:leader peptidase (prepilin peptidase)/N-methyltransferase
MELAKMMDELIVFTGVATVLGALIGSFLNVVIYRLPRDISFVTGRSGCPHCDALIHWWQNIPLLSYMLLRGKCHSCSGRISFRYPLVELLTALAFGGWTYKFGPTVEAAGYIFLTSMLICVLFIDWDFQIIPDKLTLPSLIAGLLWAAFTPLGVVGSLFGVIVGGGGLLLVAMFGDWLFKKESMGGGDIKLAAVLGAFLGWRLVLLVFFMSALIGSVVSIAWLIISSEMRDKRVIPFGPFLAIAAVVAALWGTDLMNWYIQSFLVV